MLKRFRIGLVLLLGLSIVVAGVMFFRHHTIAVLSPQGTIASQERRLIFLAVGLSIIVVLPVFIMTILFAWKYRASNKRAIYKPDWGNNRIAEGLWWGIPTLIILVLSVITWQSSHSLDPYKALASPQPPMTIQVVALQWKWLFIYPEQHLASVNFVAMPEQRPVHFEITSDAPMNSFWIPQLGGQIYAMSGMVTSLNLMADHAGSYRGSSANISGEGFGSMHFVAQAMTAHDFTDWVTKTRNANKQYLDQSSYARLAQPSQNVKPMYYASVNSNLYNNIVMKYMTDANMDMGNM